MKKFTLIVVLCLVTTLAFCNISVKEKEALIALYNTTQGNNWTNSWNIEDDISTWYGVVVENGKVISLN